MGQQTCIVLLGFVSIHAALILSLVAISSHEWIHATPHNSTVENRTGFEECNKGLWQLCCDECNPVNSTVEHKYFKACQSLYVIGTGFLAVAVFLLYIFLFGNRMNNSAGFAFLIVFCVLISAFAFTTVVIVMGVKYHDTVEFPVGYDLELAWSYFVSVAGTVCTFVASCTSGSEAYLLKTRVAGYENI